MTEQFLDNAFKDIRFSNKDKVESVLSQIETEWVSKLRVFKPDAVGHMEKSIKLVFRLLHYRALWKKLDKYDKRDVVVFLFGNRRYFVDEGAITWVNIEKYESILVQTGEPYMRAELVREVNSF